MKCAECNSGENWEITCGKCYPQVDVADLRKIVEEMRKDEMKANTTQALQGYHEASGDWADRIEQLLKRGE